MKCKSTHKLTIGLGCGKESKERMYGLCMDCKTKWILETSEGDQWLSKMLESNKNKHEKEQAKLERDEKQRKKDELIDWSKKLQDKVNQIVRLIDAGLPCLARNYHANQYHAGHVFARGGNQTIRFNLANIHRQSAQSNKWLNDDGALREGVVREYGQEYMDFISNLRQTPSLEYMNHEYKEFFQLARTIFLDMKKKGMRFPNPIDRIKARNEVNIMLGIYTEEFNVFKS